MHLFVFFLLVVKDNFNIVQGIKFNVENNDATVRVGHPLKLKCDVSDFPIGSDDCTVYFNYGIKKFIASFYVQRK